MKFINKNGIEYKINDRPAEKYFTLRDLHDLRINFPHDECVMLFGYKSEDVLCIIEEYERKKRMTREEAEKLVCKFAYNINTDRLFDGKGLPPERQFIMTLEALGLLKFEEAPGPDCRELIFSNQKPLAYQVIAQLEDLGYKVDKRS